jgi:hypothetical protein
MGLWKQPKANEIHSPGINRSRCRFHGSLFDYVADTVWGG